jgi:hypothetical protein
MNSVVLDEQEWQQVLGILATAPWRDANPLLMKIGNQLRAQQQVAASKQATPPLGGNGQEAHHE